MIQIRNYQIISKFLKLTNSQSIHRTYARRVKDMNMKRRTMKREMGLDPDKFNEADIDPEEFDAINETDPMEYKQSIRQRMREMDVEQERLKHLIVRDKYFQAPKLPNFLTWTEKEQIRYLHRDDPEEWSAEKLQQSFPVGLETVRKLLKSNWIPANEQRIKKHDEKVRENWKEFNEKGMKDLEPELIKHLRKFSNRKIDEPFLTERGMVTRKSIKLPEPRSREFSNILTSCPKYKSNQIEPIEQLPDPVQITDGKLPKNNPFSSGPKSKSSEPITFSQLQSENDYIGDANQSVQLLNNPSGTGVVTKSVNEFPLGQQKYADTTRQVEDEHLKQLCIPRIREQITIPKQLYKKGATYRLIDCFYDEDGEFLYRVPGMNGRKQGE